MQALADKILVLGIDGMDPRVTQKYLAEGKMPSLQKFVDLGAQREDLSMLEMCIRDSFRYTTREKFLPKIIIKLFFLSDLL